MIGRIQGFQQLPNGDSPRPGPGGLAAGSKESYTVPANPLIYHIVHIDSTAVNHSRWTSVVRRRGGTGNLRPTKGTSIGMSEVKDRRRHTALSSHPELMVGD